MAWPPPVPPANRTNPTPQTDNHPADHNMISVALTELVNKVSAMEALIAPIGSVMPWPGDGEPGGYLFCRGQPISRTTYSAVFAIVGVKFGVGNGTSTFNLPDLRGRYIIGYNQGGSYLSAGIGEQYGNKDATLPVHGHGQTGTHSADHSHGFTTGENNVGWVHSAPDGGAFMVWRYGAGNTGGFTAGAGSDFQVYGFTGGPSTNHVHSGSTGGASANHTHTVNNAGSDPTNANLPPSTSFNWIMRMT